MLVIARLCVIYHACYPQTADTFVHYFLNPLFINKQLLLTVGLQCVEFEKLADALLESDFSMLDKYCTLPGKRPPAAKTLPTPGRPVSTTGSCYCNAGFCHLILRQFIYSCSSCISTRLF